MLMFLINIYKEVKSHDICVSILHKLFKMCNKNLEELKGDEEKMNRREGWAEVK